MVADLTFYHGHTKSIATYTIMLSTELAEQFLYNKG